MSVILIGYSGHAFVVADILQASGCTLVGYSDHQEKALNPFDLPYLGQEQSDSGLAALRKHSYFVSIGNNHIRRKVTLQLQAILEKDPLLARHPTAVVSDHSRIGPGTMIAPQVTVNALAVVEIGTILNTACVVEHECHIGAYAHIAPGAVLVGNVRVGAGTFVGAQAVVKQGITIGKNVTIGAGSVIIRDVPDGVTIVGNPGRIL